MVRVEGSQLVLAEQARVDGVVDARLDRLVGMGVRLVPVDPRALLLLGWVGLAHPSELGLHLVPLDQLLDRVGWDVVALVVLLVHWLLLGATWDLWVLVLACVATAVLELVGRTLLVDVDIGVVVIDDHDLAARREVLAAHVGLVDELFQVVLAGIHLKRVLLGQYSSVELVGAVAGGCCLRVVGILLLLSVYRLVGFLDHLRLWLCLVALRLIIKRLIPTSHMIVKCLPSIKRVWGMKISSESRVRLLVVGHCCSSLDGLLLGGVLDGPVCGAHLLSLRLILLKNVGAH